MRVLLHLIIFILPVIGHAQSPVHWSVTSKKVDSTTYDLYITASIKDHWYLYAHYEQLDGIEGPKFSWNNEAVQAGPEKVLSVPESFDDPIFSKRLAIFRSTAHFIQTIKLVGDPPPALKLFITGYAAKDQEFQALIDTISIPFTVVRKNQTFSIIRPEINVDHPEAGCGTTPAISKRGLSIFFLGLLGGMIALLTPCVFPMIPVTVSFFTHQSGGKRSSMVNGITYGSFIFSIYILCSVPFHLIDGLNPQTLNTIATSAELNLIFFVIFILFALSFFGLFEITLPASVSNLAGSRTGISSLTGIFFMALTLVVVSFSCTGPILGSLLVGSVSSSFGAWQLTFGMAGFGLALGLPFALFAIFPGWLNKLPRSGSWMNVVKKSLAFVELALAIKFLSNADLVRHWGVLKREIFIGLWILISISLSLYLLGVFRPKPFQPSPVLQIVRPVKPVPKIRLTFGCLALLFTFYLIPGVTPTSYANLKLLSGFPPPLSYSIYNKKFEKGALHPDVINDYEKALQLAREKNKPVLIDFTGWACVNCRKMEEQVWTDPAVLALIRDKFILVSLYVDDRKKLPANEQISFCSRNGEAKDISTIGDRYATFQAENFRQVTQPLYVILDPNEKLLNHPVGYTPDAKEYKSWLDCGYRAFSASNQK